MLYERWRQISRLYANEIAVRDLTAGSQWTFQELTRVSESAGSAEGRVAFPQGMSGGFILSVLQAWRAGQIVCPLELDQAKPEIGSEMPEHIVVIIFCQ